MSDESKIEIISKLLETYFVFKEPNPELFTDFEDISRLIVKKMLPEIEAKEAIKKESFADYYSSIK